MTTHRRNRWLCAVLLAASSALLGTGCSSGSDTGARSHATATDTSDAVANDDMTLDGVRFDVRRDPG